MRYLNAISQHAAFVVAARVVALYSFARTLVDDTTWAAGVYYAAVDVAVSFALVILVFEIRLTPVHDSKDRSQ